MRKPKDFSNHVCCPEEWKRTSDMTGSFELDATILRMPNKDMRDRLKAHLVSDEAYRRRNDYNGYNGMD